jgi:hypothetical protein
MVSTAARPSHLILWFPPIQFTINSESTMDPFCLKLQVERSNYIRAYIYTGGFCSSTGIQIEQSTNQPKLFTNPEIQLEACIVTERSKNCLLAFEYPEASQLSFATTMFYNCGNSAPQLNPPSIKKLSLPKSFLFHWPHTTYSCSLCDCHHTPSGSHDNRNKIISS